MVVKIKDIGEIITGNTPSKKEESYWDSEDICFVKPDIISDTGISIIEDSNEYISKNARNRARVVGKGTVLVTCIGSIGKVGIVSNDESAFNQQINAIVPYPTVNARYLAYAMIQARQRLEAIANAPVVPIINKTQFGDFQINIENDVSKQEIIVLKLDKLCAIIESRKKELAKLDELTKARFVELFGDPIRNEYGWKTLSLLDSLEKGRTVSYGIVQTGDDFENGVPVFRPIDIAAGHMPKREDLKKTDPLISAQYKRTLLKGNELLITVRGSVGETFQTTPEFEGCNVGRNIVPLVTEPNKINQRFLQELFAQDPIKRWLKGITKGIALQGLNMSEFKEMPVIMPPLEKQNSFVVFAKQVDKSKIEVQKSLDEAQFLFDSLMQQYFG